MKNFKADYKKVETVIEWLKDDKINPYTIVRDYKKTDVTTMTLYNLKKGKSKVMNMSFLTAIVLTEFYDEYIKDNKK